MMKYFKHEDGIRIYRSEGEAWDGVTEISDVELLKLRSKWNKDNPNAVGLSNPYGQEPLSDDAKKGGVFNRVNGRLVRKTS